MNDDVYDILLHALKLLVEAEVAWDAPEGKLLSALSAAIEEYERDPQRGSLFETPAV